MQGLAEHPTALVIDAAAGDLSRHRRQSQSQSQHPRLPWTCWSAYSQMKTHKLKRKEEEEAEQQQMPRQSG